jgi:H+/gluconate symporter-like permease
VYQLPLQTKQAWANAGAYNFQICPPQKKKIPTSRWVVSGIIFGVIVLCVVAVLVYEFWWKDRKPAPKTLKVAKQKSAYYNNKSGQVAAKPLHLTLAKQGSQF